MTKAPHILRLREYQSATIGSQWDAARKVVPPYVVAELERLQAEQHAEYVAISRRRIKAQNYVGVIGVGDRTIEILPKIDKDDDAARRQLVQMMSLAGVLPHLESGIADLAPSVPCLLDVFMQAYTRQLALEWRRGRISNYQKTDENRTCLRVTFPTFSLFGIFEPEAIPAAFFRRIGAGGDFVMKVNDLSW